LRTACSTAAFHHAGRLTEGSNESDTRHLGVSHLVRVWFSTRQSGLRVRPGAERQMESGVEGIGHYSDALYTNTCPAIVTDLIAPDGVQLKKGKHKSKADVRRQLPSPLAPDGNFTASEDEIQLYTDPGEILLVLPSFSP